LGLCGIFDGLTNNKTKAAKKKKTKQQKRKTNKRSKQRPRYDLWLITINVMLKK